MGINLYKGVFSAALGLLGGGLVVVAPGLDMIGWGLIAAAGLLILWGIEVNGQFWWQRFFPAPWRPTDADRSVFVQNLQGILVAAGTDDREAFDRSLRRAVEMHGVVDPEGRWDGLMHDVVAKAEMLIERSGAPDYEPLRSAIRAVRVAVYSRY